MENDNPLEYYKNSENNIILNLLQPIPDGTITYIGKVQSYDSNFVTLTNIVALPRGRKVENIQQIDGKNGLTDILMLDSGEEVSILKELKDNCTLEQVTLGIRNIGSIEEVVGHYVEGF